MSGAFVLITGTLFREAEQRTAKSGKPYVMAVVKCGEGPIVQWWKLTAFGDAAMVELLRLRDGDSLSAQGPMRVETYERDGVTKISLRMIADQVLALRQPKKSKTNKPPAAHEISLQIPNSSPPFNDDVPF